MKFPSSMFLLCAKVYLSFRVLRKRIDGVGVHGKASKWTISQEKGLK
jgi:hypothetical protein